MCLFQPHPSTVNCQNSSEMISCRQILLTLGLPCLRHDVGGLSQAPSQSPNSKNRWRWSGTACHRNQSTRLSKASHFILRDAQKLAVNNSSIQKWLSTSPTEQRNDRSICLWRAMLAGGLQWNSEKLSQLHINNNTKKKNNWDVQNDSGHYSTTAQSVSWNSVWRNETWGACRRQLEKGPTWRPVTDRSRHVTEEAQSATVKSCVYWTNKDDKKAERTRCRV